MALGLASIEGGSQLLIKAHLSCYKVRGIKTALLVDHAYTSFEQRKIIHEVDLLIFHASSYVIKSRAALIK